MTGFAADARTLSEYQILEANNNLEELLMQYVVEEANLREQEKLCKKSLHLKTLSNERFVAALVIDYVHE